MNIAIQAYAKSRAPSFIASGLSSGRIGRKKVMVAGCALAASTYVLVNMGKHFGNAEGHA